MCKKVFISLLIVFSCGVQAHDADSVKFNHLLKVKNLSGVSAEEEAKLKKQFEDRKKIVNSIEAEGLINSNDVNALVSEYHADLLMDKYFRKFLKDAVKRADVRAYYDANTSEFESEKIKLSHILLQKDVEREGGVKTPQFADELYQRLLNGEDFSVLARQYSDDKLSGMKGGDLGWVPEGFLNRAFSDQVFSMQKGQMSEVFKSKDGFHIVLIDKNPKVDVLPFSAVKAKITKYLERQARKAETVRLKSL